MKFSFRLISVTLLFCTAVTVLVFFNKWSLLKQLPFENVGLDHKKGRNFGSNIYNQNKNDVFKSSNLIYEVSNREFCSKVLTNAALANINTADLLHKIDNLYNEDWVEKPKKFMQHYFNINETLEPDLKRSKTLKIIVVPHAHSDPGWLKTLDGYFEDQTRDTLNFMVEKLLKYPNMTFIWAESVFLSMWWKDVDYEMRETVKRLIKKNQLEIVGGSWVVPDEANSHYFGVIDQMIEGHQWLEQNLGIKPKNTWSLDPFGYSPSLAYLYKKAGFNNMVILRIHQLLKMYFEGNKYMEFNWRQHWDLAGSTDMFTMLLPYMLYNIKHQCGPNTFVCRHFDFRKIDGEMSDSLSEVIHSGNVAKFAETLLSQLTQKNKLYKHNVVLMPIGDDFRFDRSIEWDQQYENYQNLFHYMNNNKYWNVHAKFGTLNDYFEEVHKELKDNAKVSIPTLQGDFFPYTDKNDEYWTGYFSTRAFDKNLERELEINLRTAEIFNVLAKALSQKGERYLYYKSNILSLTTARQNLGLFQHHDGITGTARAYVVIDYEHRLQQGLQATRNVIENAAQYLMASNRDQTSFIQLSADQPKSLYMLKPGKKILDFSEHKNRTVLICNPTGRTKEEIIRITTNNDYLEVYDENGQLVLSQINPLWRNEVEISERKFQLIFLALLKPLSIAKFTILAIPSHRQPKENLAAFMSFKNFKFPIRIPQRSRFLQVAPRGETIILENEFLRARFSARNGYLQSISTKARLATKKIHSELLMYKSRRSGAYIFAPAGPSVDTEMFNLPPMMILKGPVVSEIHVYQRENVCEHIVRVYNSSRLLGTVLEINNLSNMTLKDDKELILKLSTDMKNTNTEFYTDLNGLHSIKRQRFKNFPKEANYYPMTSYAYIEDKEARLSILSAQSLGVSSQENGSLEIMLDRKPLYDDGRGLGEGVIDSKLTPSQFYLLLEKPVQEKPSFYEKSFSKRLDSYPSLHAHLLVEQIQQHATVLFDLSEKDLLRNEFSGMSKSLPCDTKLINLRGMLPMKNNGTSNSLTATMILHKHGYDCSYPLMGYKCDLSQSDISFTNIFKDAKIQSMQNVSLSLMYEYNNIDVSSPFKLSPMDLQSFKVTFKEL